MTNADTIWRLGRWIGEGRSGTLRLRWQGGEAVLDLSERQLVGLRGPDPRCVAERLGMEPAGREDLLEEALELAGREGIPGTRALTAVKACLEQVLREWLLDSGREIEPEESEVPVVEGPAISLPHVMVELVLGSEEPGLANRILPDERLLLRRGPGFLERYAALQLAEEADLVVAKVTESRTVGEILARSPHSAEEVRRLLAALVGAGLLEPVPVAEPEPEEILFSPEPEPELDRAAIPETTVRPLPWRWIGLAGFVLLLVLAAAAFWFRPQAPETAGIHPGASWGVVVDMGCEAVDYERILRKVRKHPRKLQAVRTDGGDSGGGDCWRLVWGRFPSREEAERAVEAIPADALAEGFTPHVVEVGESPGEAGGSTGS